MNYIKVQLNSQMAMQGRLSQVFVGGILFHLYSTKADSKLQASPKSIIIAFFKNLLMPLTLETQVYSLSALYT